MDYTTALKRSTVPVIGGLLLGVYAGSLLFAGLLRMGDGPAWQRWLRVPIDAFGVSFYALLATVLPTLLVWWPVYSLLWCKGRANWLTVAALPLLAALPWALSEPIIASLAALYGLCIALATHALHRRLDRSPPPASAA